MRNEITWRRGHLMWTRSGTVWATWRLSPRPYGFADPAEKDKVRRQHQELFQAIRGEALLLGLSSRTDAAGVVNRMMRGVRMDRCPAHLEEASRTLGELEEMTMGRRAYFLSVPLARLDVRSRLLSQAKAAYGIVRDSIGARRLTPSALESVAAQMAANHVQAALPPVFKARPATVAEQSWIYAHQMLRGLDIEVPEPEQPAGDAAGFASGAEFGDPWLDEGGMSEIDSAAKRLNPMRRRFLKVQSPHAEDPSYQVMLALTGTPAGGWMFPGVEWLSWCDQFPVDIDWAVRLHVYDSQTARTKNRHAEQGLDDQISQLAGENTITGGQQELQRNAEQLHEFHSQLAADEREVEVQPTTVFSVAADTAQQALADAVLVARAYRAQSFILDPVVGEQESLWWSTLPGTPTLPIARQLAQLTTGRDFSTTVPLVSYELGDADGVLVGVNRATHNPTPFFLNPHGATQSNQSGCLAVIGDLGKGKSVLLKKIAGSAFDRGASLVIVDRSPTMEYAAFASSLAEDSTAIVEILEPAYSLDPVRVFGAGEEGARLALELLTSLLSLDANSAESAYLSELLAPDEDGGLAFPSLRALRDHLQASDAPGARSLAQRMNSYARHKVGRVLFDDSLPALNLRNRAIVFCTRGLEIPGEEEMRSQTWKPTLAQIFGPRMYKYLATIGKTICFADPAVFALFVTDEVRELAENPGSRKELKEFVLQGRKAAAAIMLGGQLVSHLGGLDLWGLIPIRIVCGHEEAHLARQAAEWIGWDPDVEENVKAIQNCSPRDPNRPHQDVPPERRGEIIVRDAYGRVGQAKVLLPYEPSRRAAVLTTPPRDEGRAA